MMEDHMSRQLAVNESNRDIYQTGNQNQMLVEFSIWFLRIILCNFKRLFKIDFPFALKNYLS